ncbi:hypothetical protein AB6D11_02830 [Vibrio splendidus]
MFKISEINTMEDLPAVVTSVASDAVVFEYPEHLTDIGLLVHLEDGKIASNVMDNLIFAGDDDKLSVLLEVPFDVFPYITVEEIISTSMSMNVALSILPPENNDKDDWEKYGDLSLEFLDFLLNNSQNEKELLPLSAYFQYMCGEALGHIPDQMTEDGYMQSNFVDMYEVEVLDAYKLRLREVILARYGGLEGLRVFLNSLLVGVRNKLVEPLQKMKAVQEESESSTTDSPEESTSNGSELLEEANDSESNDADVAVAEDGLPEERNVTGDNSEAESDKTDNQNK